jgi:hypothetical protein
MVDKLDRPAGTPALSQDGRHEHHAGEGDPRGRRFCKSVEELAEEGDAGKVIFAGVYVPENVPKGVEWQEREAKLLICLVLEADLWRLIAESEPAVSPRACAGDRASP